jgi:hypothetical protein
MQTVNLFAYQKNLDLHCISAKEAITQFLGFDRLINLRRFRMWDFDFTSESQDTEGQVESVLAGSYQILNPNKEGYYLDRIPLSKQVADSVFYVKVTRHIADTTPELLSGVNQRLGTVLSDLKESVLWEITIDFKGDSRESVSQLVQERIVETTARDKGLLVNPLFESFEFLDPQTVIRA